MSHGVILDALSPIYEAMLRCPTSDNYEKHQYLERQFKQHGDNSPRRYVWAGAPGRTAYVRYHRPIGTGIVWNIVEIPPIGSKIRFKFSANVRVNDPNNDRRVTDLDYFRNLQWIGRIAPLIGLELLNDSVDVQSVSIPIRNPENRFRLWGSMFEGIAFIRSEEQFTNALARSVGNGRGFGLGFIFFSTFRRG